MRKTVLFGMAREEPLKRDEDEPQKDEVDDEEVEAKEKARRLGRTGRHPKAAQKGGKQRHGKGRDTQRLAGAQHHRQRGQREGRNKQEQDHEAEPGRECDPLKLGRRESIGELERQDKGQPRDRGGEADRSSDPAGAEGAVGAIGLQLGQYLAANECKHV